MVDVGDENLRCTHHSPYDHPLSITENFLFSYFLSQKMLPLQLILPDFFFFCLGFWPRLFDILCCDVIPRSQQFHEFWFEAAYFFKLNVLRHHKKTQLVILENQWYGVSRPIRANSRPFRANSRLRFLSTNFHILPDVCGLCNAHWIMSQVVSATIHTFWPKLQYMFMLPKSAKIAYIQDSALRPLFGPNHCLGWSNSCWNFGPKI